MYLKSLEVHGFKSFADPTLIEFHRGVTAIVGPNGCGKSNVLDSIRWALGEQSAKALRGAQMQDVIFNGTDYRKPMGMAEVSMTFADCEGILGVDFHEVRITRRVFRDGGSEYEINKTPSRLKDIHQLFMDTGIGRTAYSIMEQGKIDQIISSKPEDRRVVFEEAAGITKFKSQKKEALRKLEQTEANLIRVSDIIKEVRRQIGSLQRQANKARRYREYHERLRYLEIRLGLRRMVELKGGLEEVETRLAAVIRESGGIEEVIAADEQALRVKREELAALESELRQLENQRSTTQGEIERIRQEIQFHEARIGELEGLIEKNRAEIAAAGEKQKIQEQQLQLVLEDVAQIDGQIGSLRDKVRVQGESLARLKSRQAEEEGKRAQLQRERGFLEEGSRKVENRLAAIELQQANYIQRMEKLAEEEKTLVGQKSLQEERAAGLVSRASALEQRREALGGEVAALEAQLQALQAESDQARTGLEMLQAEVSQRQARLSALRKLHESRAGFSKTTQELLKKFTGPGMEGPLLDHLRAKAGYERAIQACLGMAWEALIISRAELLQEIVAELGQGGTAVLAGSALAVAEPAASPEAPAGDPVQEELFESGFFQKLLRRLTGSPSASPAAGPRPQAPAYPEHARSAVHFVKADGVAADLVRNLLDGYYIAERFEDIPGLRAQIGRGHFVARDGQMARGEGFELRGSPKDAQQSVLELANELHALEAEAPEEIARLDAAKAFLEQKRADLAASEKRLAERRQELRQGEAEASALQIERQGLEREIEALDRKLGAAAEERKHLGEEQSLRREEEDKARAELKKIREEAEAKDRAAEELRGLVEQLSSEQSALATAINDLRVEIASTEQRSRGLGSQRETCQARVNELRVQFEERTGEIQEYEARIRQAREGIETGRSKVEEALRRSGGFDEEFEKRAIARREIDQTYQELEERARISRRRAGELQQERSSCEVKAAERRMHYENLRERIQRTYQLDITDESACLAVAEEYEKSLLAPKASPALPVPAEEEPAASEAPAEAAGETAAEGGEPLPEAAEEAPSGLAGSPVLPEAAEPDWPAWEQEASELRDKIDGMGPVNVEAITEYEELEQRGNFLDQQERDLLAAKDQLLEAIKKINQTTQAMFAETFAKIRENFSQMFLELFGGGKADLILQDENDPLECGIDIVARPPGKQLQSISLLSGGERTMTAVSLLFAIYMVKPSPFCVLDEMDAPLDESNVGRFVRILQRFVSQSQFVVITHNKRTIGAADVLYGVTMQEHGVSRLVSVKLTRDEETPLFANGGGKSSSRLHKEIEVEEKAVALKGEAEPADAAPVSEEPVGEEGGALETTAEEPGLSA
jgi:chromosome segregation protein